MCVVDRPNDANALNASPTQQVLVCQEVDGWLVGWLCEAEVPWLGSLPGLPVSTTVYAREVRCRWYFGMRDGAGLERWKMCATMFVGMLSMQREKKTN